MHLNFGVVNRVLLAASRNHSANFFGHSFARKIFTFHNDSSIVVCLDYGLRVEHTLQVVRLLNCLQQICSPRQRRLFSVFRFRSPSTHNMSPIVRRLFLHFLPKLMMMRRTKYILPDYDDNAPSHGYINEIDVR